MKNQSTSEEGPIHTGGFIDLVDAPHECAVVCVAWVGWSRASGRIPVINQVEDEPVLQPRLRAGEDEGETS